MVKPKILISGGSHAEIPLIVAAQKMGFCVVTSGNRPNDIGHTYSDIYEPADFSDNEQMLQLAQKHNISAVCSGCNDFSAISSAYVAEQLGLPGHDSYENTLTIHHKDRFRAFCIKNNLSVPKAKGFSNFAEAFRQETSFSFPVIIKPVDLTGGKGISIVNNALQYETAINKAFEISRTKKIVVEEFIEGSGHGFSALIHKGRVAFYFADDEYYVPDEFWVTGTSTPASISDDEIKQLIFFSEKTISLLGLVDGLFHIQCIIKHGKVYIIEVCRRPPGDLYLKFIEHATSFDYSKAIIQFLTAQLNNSLIQIDANGFYARHCLSGLKKGYITDVRYSKEITENLIEEFRLWDSNVEITNYVSQKAVILFMQFQSQNKMKIICNHIYQYITFVMHNNCL